MILTLLTWLKNPIVQWGIAILGALLGYQAWTYYQQNKGAQKQIQKQKEAAKKAEEKMNNAKVPETNSEVEDLLNHAKF